MTFEFILNQNWFINECARKNFLKFHKDGNTERRKYGKTNDGVFLDVEELTLLIRCSNMIFSFTLET